MKKRILNIFNRAIRAENYMKVLKTNLDMLQRCVNQLPKRDKERLQPWLDDSQLVLKKLLSWLDALKAGSK